MTKKEREALEYKSLFEDERYAKKAWKEFIGRALQSSAAPLPTFLDKNGNIAPQSELDMMAYQNIKKRLAAQGLDREPMQAEMMVENAVLRSRFDTNTLNMLLERTAGKVKEELTVNANQYENLSDEVIVTVIATGFDKSRKQSSGEQPVFNNGAQTQNNNRRVQDPEVLKEDEEEERESSRNNDNFEWPSFLQDRNY